MSATIKYKGDTIATISTTSNKTLQTNGKYCEADIIVENVQDGGSTLITKNISSDGTYNACTDGADGYSVVVVDVMKEWTVTLSEDKTSQSLLLTDSWLATNRQNENLKILIEMTGNPTFTANSIVSSICGNKEIGTNGSGVKFYGHSLAIMSSSFDNNSQRAKIYESSYSYGSINVWGNGQLYWMASSSYPIRAGTYKITAWLDN